MYLMDIGMTIEDLIQRQVDIICSKKQLPEIQDILEVDSIGEIIEKLCILHIRNWMLEDIAGQMNTDKDYASVKRKVEICYKEKRPKFIEIINRKIDDSITIGKSLFEENIKRYKGW